MIFMQYIALAAALATGAAMLPQCGQLLWHDYSAYEAMDSRLHLCDLRTGERMELTDSSFVHAMNGDFGSHCYDITFMAIDPIADEWDIFRYNTISRKLDNLTKNSGFRNEDPKFSPDGQQIVFKRGHWSQETDGFVYDLALLDLRTQEITVLTEGGGEESMPCFSPDGRSIYYAQSGNGETSICRIFPDTGKTECLYTETGIHAYYPMTSDSGLYFTRWHSSDSRNDSIVRLNDGTPELMAFCSPEYNCSDPFPLHDGRMVFSSTKSGSYDLYFYDGTAETALSACNTDSQELGASFYAAADAQRMVKYASDHILNRAASDVNLDADADGMTDAFDLALLKRMAGFS